LSAVRAFSTAQMAPARGFELALASQAAHA